MSLGSRHFAVQPKRHDMCGTPKFASSIVNYEKICKKTTLTWCFNHFQCDQKFHHFGTILKVLGKFLRDYLVFGNFLILPWQKCYAIGQVFIVVDGRKP